MGKRLEKIKEDTLRLIQEIPSEFSLAFLIGTLPVLLFSTNTKSFDEVVSGLLAISPLIDYYGWMLAPYIAVLIIKYCFRFGTDRGKRTFDFVHKIIAEVGTGFQTILRTGSGVAMGILPLPSAIVAPTAAQYWMLWWMVGMMLIVSSAISMFRNEVTSRTERPNYKNPLKFDVK